MAVLHCNESRWCGLTLLGLLAACGADPEAGGADGIGVEVQGVGTYSEVTAFGSNPGGLKFYQYVPENMPPNAPLVLALHACSQTARDYQKAGWNELADQWKFYVLYPEQQTGNNAARCFNWAGEFSDPINTRRNEGENLSIKQAIDKMKSEHSIDATKVFLSGHSGGAAEGALLLAVWPDIFAAGAVIAGIPYLCTTNINQVTTCLNPGVNRTPMEWGDLVRRAFMGFGGPYPKVSIWQGTSDTTVNPANGREMLEQWTNVHGIDQMEDQTDTVDGFPRKQFKNAQGVTLVESWEITGQGHGTFVDPDRGCGMAGAYFIDANICSTRHIARFFGLEPGMTMPPGDTTPPAVNVTAPANGATLNAATRIDVSAMDNVGVARVELFINGASKASLTTAPYQYSWNAAAEANGTYAIRAVAYDAAGNSAADDDTRVTVMSGMVDMTPPTVNVTAPANGATVSGSVSISADASDASGIAKVEFFIDGNKIGEAAAAPYAASWDASSAAAGAHALSARAVDGAGNTSTDNDTSVTVMAGGPGPMPGDTTPPMVNIVSPAAGETARGVVTVKVDASDDVTLYAVYLFADGDLIGSDFRPPYEFLWDTSAVMVGGHTLLARAVDAAGNVSTDEQMIAVAMEQGSGEEEQPEVLTEQVKWGKRRWGCSAMPAGRDGAGTFVLLLGAMLLVRRRNKARVAAVAAVAAASALSACGAEDIYIERPIGVAAASKFGRPDKIFDWLDGKTLVMTGAAIPSHPNGFDEDINFGQATQCYKTVTMRFSGRKLTVTSVLGTLRDAVNAGDRGTCDHEAAGAELTFDSTAVLIENVKGDGECFDMTITYPGFGQEGRGKLTEEGRKLTIETYFKDQATGHRCKDGGVGERTVTLNRAAFMGDAQQTYSIVEQTQ